MGRLGVLATSAAALIALCGCSGQPDSDAVSSTARAFVAALERSDGPAACRLLTADADDSVSGATDVPCAKAITSIVEHGRAVGRVEVWGDAAQVRVGGDVLFLRRISGIWRVSAAGCTPRAQGPYDCTVGA